MDKYVAYLEDDYLLLNTTMSQTCSLGSEDWFAIKSLMVLRIKVTLRKQNNQKNQGGKGQSNLKALYALRNYSILQ